MDGGSSTARMIEVLTFTTSYNGATETMHEEIENALRSLSAHKPHSITGKGFRSGVLDCIKQGGAWSKPKKYRPLSEKSITVDTATLDPIPVGLSIQVSHSNAGKAELLHFEALFRDRSIRGAIFVTQMLDQGRKRNLEKESEGGWGGLGNRVHYESLNRQMEYYRRFMRVPLLIIGLQAES